jgi:hypothetical protein
MVNHEKADSRTARRQWRRIDRGYRTLLPKLSVEPGISNGAGCLRALNPKLFLSWTLVVPCVWLFFLSVQHSGIPENARAAAGLAPSRFVLDMADGNPGGPPIVSAFTNPKRLADWGYSGQIVNSQIEGISTFDKLAPGAIPQGSPQRDWADAHTRLLADQIQKAHAAGEKCYAWMQVLVLPKDILTRFKDQICDDRGRVDVHLPKTQELLRAQLDEIFDRLPDLDGLVIRTGEIYLQALPYHAASLSSTGMTLAGTAIFNGRQSHIDILKVLRDAVCVGRNKTVIYRTWDFGNNFHVNPDYYLAVTGAIEPHKNLIFSIKHQAGDFHQLTPFNPTIGIGKHQQIIEVQCQREGYGKGAHPYYIGQGVIEGWEEYQWLMKAGQPKGLRDVMGNPNIVGVWTWSRGGGWDGPFITNEFWCELNAYVISKYAKDPTRTEAEIFKEYEQHIGLKGEDLARFRELCELSTKAVLRGQLTTLGVDVNVWWARDDTLAAPDMSGFVKRDLVEQALSEKHLAVMMWERIEQLSKQITFADSATKEFVVTSAAYGRIKYAIIEQGWTVLLYGKSGDMTGHFECEKMLAAISKYHQLWNDFKALKANNPSCSTLPNDVAFKNKPGLGAAVEHYRKLLAEPATTSTAAPAAVN